MAPAIHKQNQVDTKTLPATTARVRKSKVPKKPRISEQQSKIYAAATIEGDQATKSREKDIATVYRCNHSSDRHYTIVAKKLLNFNKGHGKQVTHRTPCLVRDSKGKHYFMDWSYIWDSQQRGDRCLQDHDFGLGLHTPDHDITPDRRRSCQVIDAVMYECQSKSTYPITVIYSTKGGAMANQGDGLGTSATPMSIRTSFSSYSRAGYDVSVVYSILKTCQKELFERYRCRKSQQRRQQGTQQGTQPEAYDKGGTNPGQQLLVYAHKLRDFQFSLAGIAHNLESISHDLVR